MLQVHHEYIAEPAIKATVLRPRQPPGPMTVIGVPLERAWEAIVKATRMAVGEANDKFLNGRLPSATRWRQRRRYRIDPSPRRMDVVELKLS